MKAWLQVVAVLLYGSCRVCIVYSLRSSSKDLATMPLVVIHGCQRIFLNPCDFLLSASISQETRPLGILQIPHSIALGIFCELNFEWLNSWKFTNTFVYCVLYLSFVTWAIFWIGNRYSLSNNFYSFIIFKNWNCLTMQIYVVI